MHFTYLAPPTVSSVSPNSGSTSGGTAVTITGTNFAAGATVTFGGAAATNVVVVNSTTITATTPAGSAGAVTVTVKVSGQSGSLTNGFTYVVIPDREQCGAEQRSDGGWDGGDDHGDELCGRSDGDVWRDGSDECGGGERDDRSRRRRRQGVRERSTVTVTVNSQSGSLTNGFTYVVAPTVSSVSPNSGSTRVVRR